ncbi:MAG: hypothetical protein Kow00121_01040 [Elainellaceae cyanobacterium]
MIGVLVDGRYEIVKILGGGAFGQTFLARDMKRPGQPSCVIKQLRYYNSNPKAIEHARRLFKKEAEILEKLGHHSQIPTLLADIEEHQEFYLVEQFIPGQSLGQEIVPGVYWSEEQVVHLLQEVLQILVFVHGQGVIHRDIKPANLMRRESDGKIVLIDFGAVKELGTQIAQSPSVPTIAIGTPGYMAIEQFNGLPQLNSDIYALGIIAIQALLGLAADELSGLKDSHSHPPGEVVWRHRRSVNPLLADVIDNMVRADYRQRYQTAEEVLGDLRYLGEGSTVLPAAAAASASTMLVTPEQQALTQRSPERQTPDSQVSNSYPLNSQLPNSQPSNSRPSNSQTVIATPAVLPPRSPRSNRRLLTGLTILAVLGSLVGAGYSQKGRFATYFYNQGKEQARYGEVKGALENFTRAIQINPNYADAYARRCGSRLTLEDDEGAMQDCQKAIDLDANNAIAYLNWGNLYAEQRDQENATQHYTRSVELSSRLIQLNPQDADGYYYRGAGRFRLGDYRGAIADATQAIERDAEYANAYLTRCQAHGQLGEHQQAVEDCQQATEINPNYYAAFASLCNNLSNTGDYEAAIEACTRALQINPNDSHAYNNRGVVWLRLKDYQAAIDDYRQAIQRDPKDAVAQHNLGDVLRVQNDYQGAIAAYTKAIELNPSFAAAYYGRGISQATLGNVQEAVADLQEAANLYSQQGRQDQVNDALYQVRRIQGEATVPETPQPEEPQPEVQPSIPVQETAAPAQPTNSVPSTPYTQEPSFPVRQPEPYVPEPSAPYVQEPPAPYVQEPAAPYSAPTDPYVEEPAPYVEEPPAPYIQEPEAPAFEPAPYVEEPPAPYSAPVEPELPDQIEVAPSVAPPIEAPQGGEL